MIRAGKLRYLITLQRATESQDSATGEVVKSWGTLAQRWAGFETLSGREYFDAASRRVEAASRFWLRAEHGNAHAAAVTMLNAGGAAAGAAPAVAVSQSVNLADACGGTFTLAYPGSAVTTAAIAYNASNATVQTALRATSDAQLDDAVVTGGPLPGNQIVVAFGYQAGTTLLVINAAALVFFSSLSTKDRVLYDGNTYDIEAIIPSERPGGYMQLMTRDAA